MQESGGDQQQALQQLFMENRLPNPQSQPIAQFVLLEFMRWQVAFGGFRAFNYENYNGWMGGGSFLQTPPPYAATQGVVDTQLAVFGTDNIFILGNNIMPTLPAANPTLTLLAMAFKVVNSPGCALANLAKTI